MFLINNKTSNENASDYPTYNNPGEENIDDEEENNNNEEEKINIVKKLIQQNRTIINNQDEDGFTPLMFACEKNYVKICDLLIENGANIHTTNSGN